MGQTILHTRTRDEEQVKALNLTAEFLQIATTSQAISRAIDEFIATYAAQVAQWLPAYEAAQEAQEAANAAAKALQDSAERNES